MLLPPLKSRPRDEYGSKRACITISAFLLSNIYNNIPMLKMSQFLNRKDVNNLNLVRVVRILNS